MTYISLFLLMIFYSILGLNLFRGIEENLCRITEYPIDNNWIADENNKIYCGQAQCHEGF